jgi:hypothetical protein
MSIEVEIVREASDELVGAVARLLPQLSTTAGPCRQGIGDMAAEQ